MTGSTYVGRPDTHRTPTGIGLIAAAAAVVVAVLAVTACSGRHPSRATPSAAAVQTSLGSAVLGDLRLSGGYIPEPASPDVASAYLTITDTGRHADRVTAVVTNVTSSVMAMQETSHGGAGTMTDIAALTVPAHGSVALSPGHAHLMLDNPTRILRTGDTVTMSVTFATAGTVTVVLPVVPITGPPQSVPTRT